MLLFNLNTITLTICLVNSDKIFYPIIGYLCKHYFQAGHENNVHNDTANEIAWAILLQHKMLMTHLYAWRQQMNALRLNFFLQDQLQSSHPVSWPEVLRFSSWFFLSILIELDIHVI